MRLNQVINCYVYIWILFPLYKRKPMYKMAQEPFAVIMLFIYEALKDMQYNEANYELQMQVFVQIEDAG